LEASRCEASALLASLEFNTNILLSHLSPQQMVLLVSWLERRPGALVSILTPPLSWSESITASNSAAAHRVGGGSTNSGIVGEDSSEGTSVWQQQQQQVLPTSTENGGFHEVSYGSDVEEEVFSYPFPTATVKGIASGFFKSFLSGKKGGGTTSDGGHPQNSYEGAAGEDSRKRSRR